MAASRWAEPHGRHWAVLVTVTGQASGPPLGRSHWPLTALLQVPVKDTIDSAQADEGLAPGGVDYGLNWIAGRCYSTLGYMELARRGAELLSQALTEREEKSAIAIASNEPFTGWTKTFADPRLCAAIVDRLTFNGQVIETGTTSRRLAHVRAARRQLES